MTEQPHISMLVQTVCIWEATARKLGNVHPKADFADLAYTDFLLSAAAIAPCFQQPRGIGQTVLEAVRCTQRWIGRNTNLGIILLLAPFNWSSSPEGLRSQLRKHLASMDTTHEARWVYQAIREAKPGGLGTVPNQDVHAEPSVGLIEAMRLAADRDLVARQYANEFADVFDFGVPTLLTAFERFGCIEAAVIDTQLRWLAQYPDSLIQRKNGPSMAIEVQQQARRVLSLGGIQTPEGRAEALQLDRHLRSNGHRLNPGTTADLITACLFVALRENTLTVTAPFRWSATDWL